MWEPRRLTTLWAFTACYNDSFTFFNKIHIPVLNGLSVIDVKLNGKENIHTFIKSLFYALQNITLRIFLAIQRMLLNVHNTDILNLPCVQ
jgi:hypothetical protein